MLHALPGSAVYPKPRGGPKADDGLAMAHTGKARRVTRTCFCRFDSKELSENTAAQRHFNLHGNTFKSCSDRHCISMGTGLHIGVLLEMVGRGENSKRKGSGWVAVRIRSE